MLYHATGVSVDSILVIMLLDAKQMDGKFKWADFAAHCDRAVYSSPHRKPEVRRMDLNLNGVVVPNVGEIFEDLSGR